jgi:hypothetical protein
MVEAAARQLALEFDVEVKAGEDARQVVDRVAATYAVFPDDKTLLSLAARLDAPAARPPGS